MRQKARVEQGRTTRVVRIEIRSRVQAYPSTIRFLWILAGMADSLKDPREAHARAVLGLAAGDQLSIDPGFWTPAPVVGFRD